MERKYLPNSETFVSVEDDDIIGFISMRENNLAALFVHKSSQSKGLGSNYWSTLKGEENRFIFRFTRRIFTPFNFI